MTNPPIKDKLSCLLKETRQQKGITLEMVHEATKIPLDALRAIEQGYSVHKLQTFYYRGFIKIYTKYLELDETQVLQEYGMLESAAPKVNSPVAKEVSPTTHTHKPVSSKVIAKEPSKPVFSREMFNKRLGVIIRAVAIIICFFLIFKASSAFVSKMQQNKKQAAVPKPVVPKPAVKPQTKSSSKTKSKETVEKDVKKDPVVKTPVAAVAEQPSTTPVKKNEETKSGSRTEEKSDKKSKIIELTVRATKNGWLQVKTDGQIVFQSALKKGDSETWKAESEIELSGKNINLLEFELNGKMLGARGASDRGAKKVVFTKDGLSVKK